MKAVITCGGTGGHITPALAIADMIKENDPRAEILFVGGMRGMEGELVGGAGYTIRLLDVQGISRKLTLANFKALWGARQAVKEARRILSAFSPDIVIGTGGYACYPTLRAALKMGIPSAVHESNAAPGLAVRVLARRLDRVWLNFESAKERLPASAHVLTVGNPLPRGYSVPQPIELPRGTRQFLLSFGGSLGAGAINRAVLELMEGERGKTGLFHVHATGRREYEQMHAAFCEKRLQEDGHLSLLPFITQMPRYMAAADLVICRAGAMSISELASLGTPAVLIPSPNVTGNHQYENAKALAEKGAAVLLEEKKIGELSKLVPALLSDGERLKEMSVAIRSFYRPRANAEIWQDIVALVRQKKSGE